MSPYVMANSLSFDVTVILDDIKKGKEKKDLMNEYEVLMTKELELLLTDAPVGPTSFRDRKRLSGLKPPEINTSAR